MNIKLLVCTGALGMLAAQSLMAEGLWGIRNYRELVRIDPATANVVQTVPIVGVPASWVKFTLAYHKAEGAFYGFAFQTFFEVKLIRYDPSTGQATDLGFLPGNRYFEGLEYMDSLNSLIASAGQFNGGSPRIGTLTPDRVFTELLNNGGDNDVLAYDSRREIFYSLDTTGENFSQQQFVTKINLTNTPNAEVLDQEAAYHPRVDAFFAAKFGKLYRWRVVAGNSLEYYLVGDIPGQAANNPHTPLAYVDDDGLPTDLLAHWTADGTALDSVGGHGGALFGGVDYVSGKFGRAFKFDGANGHLRADDQIGNHPAFTLSAWVSPDEDIANHGTIVCTRDGDIEYDPEAGFTLSIWADRNGNYSELGLRYLYTPTNQLVPNQWSHVALAVSSNDTARFFINGVEVVLVERLTDGGLLSRFDTTIGGNWPRNLDYFKGRIDDVRVYGRALSSADVTKDYVFRPESRMEIRVSAVDICWNSRPGRGYQIQYHSQLTGSAWANLGGPLFGNGQQQCVTDTVSSGENRFYRVVELP